MIKRWYEAIRPHLEPLGWSIASGLLGATIGLLGAALWGR